MVVEPDGSLTVRAPMHLPRPAIEAFLVQKAGWVRKKQREIRQHLLLTKPNLYVSGELFWYLGNQYPLEILPIEKPLLALDGSFKLASQAVPQAREAFIHWYCRQARQVIGERVAFFSGQTGLTYHQVRIGGARTRWGSCSSKKNLNFTWRLVMAPLPVIDYVVVHELCHLLEPNHSQAFWSQVRAFQPEFKERRDWLRKNSRLLDLT